MVGRDPITGQPFPRVMPARKRTVYERYDDAFEQWIEVEGVECGLCGLASVIGYPDEKKIDLRELAIQLGWRVQNELFTCPSTHHL